LKLFLCLQAVSNVGRRATCLANVQMLKLPEEEEAVVVAEKVRKGL